MWPDDSRAAVRADQGGPELVIKCVRAAGSPFVNRERVAMLLEEARIGTLIRHPNVVAVHEVDYQSGCYYIVMEHLIGWDLSRIWSCLETLGERLPMVIAIHLVVEAAAGLHAAHECRTERGEPLLLVHRDVSPSNLFVTDHGLLKVLDFGLAKTAMQVHRTPAGFVKGKISYMSPEQILGKPVDRRSDIFSLGVVLHEIISGQRLFRRDTPVEIC